jgi:serine O-acetyltransferase
MTRVPLRSLWRNYSATLRRDYARNDKIDARITLAVWRLGQTFHRQPGVVPFLLRRVSRVLDVVWLRGYMGAVLPPHVQAGPGLRLPHCARGVVLHHTTRIGSEVTIYHQVTIGVRDRRPAAATIGNNVSIGAGAKILGPVTVGDGCRVGANAVVITDVPAGASAVGVPAVIKVRTAERRAGGGIAETAGSLR